MKYNNPSFFHHIYAINNAFDIVTEHMSSGSKSSNDQNLLYKIINNTLDLLEFLFLYGSSNKLHIECYDFKSTTSKNSSWERLILDDMSSDSLIANNGYNWCFFYWENQLVGGSSPYTFVYTTPDTTYLSSLKFYGYNGNVLFNNEYIPINKRAKIFQNYILCLVGENTSKNYRIFKNYIYSCLKKQHDHLDILSFENLEYLKRDSSPLRIYNHPLESDLFLRTSNKSSLNKEQTIYPLIISKSVAPYSKYLFDIKWNNNIPTKLEDNVTFEKRILPYTGIQYPYITDDDLLENYIIHIKSISSEHFITHNGYLPPFKKSIFIYYNITDATDYLKIEKVVDGVIVYLELKLLTSNNTILINKHYKKEDIKELDFNLCLFPMIKTVRPFMYKILKSEDIKINGVCVSRDNIETVFTSNTPDNIDSSDAINNIYIETACSFDILEIEFNLLKFYLIPKFRVLAINPHETTALIYNQEFSLYENENGYYQYYIKSHFNKYTTEFHKIGGFIGSGEQLFIDTLIENEYKYLFTEKELYKNKYWLLQCLSLFHNNSYVAQVINIHSPLVNKIQKSYTNELWQETLINSFIESKSNFTSYTSAILMAKDTLARSIGFDNLLLIDTSISGSSISFLKQKAHRSYELSTFKSLSILDTLIENKFEANPIENINFIILYEKFLTKEIKININGSEYKNWIRIKEDDYIVQIEYILNHRRTDDFLHYLCKDIKYQTIFKKYFGAILCYAKEISEKFKIKNLSHIVFYGLGEKILQKTFDIYTIADIATSIFSQTERIEVLITNYNNPGTFFQTEYNIEERLQYLHDYDNPYTTIIDGKSGSLEHVKNEILNNFTKSINLLDNKINIPAKYNNLFSLYADSSYSTFLTVYQERGSIDIPVFFWSMVLGFSKILNDNASPQKNIKQVFTASHMQNKDFDVFISYRRTDSKGKISGSYIARTISQALKLRHYKVFFDYSECTDGEFEKIIIPAVRSSKIFLIVLTKNALDRCKDPNDWVRKEISTAIESGCKIIPVNPDYQFNGCSSFLPEDLDITKEQFSDINMGSLFEESIEKMIRERF